MNHLERAQDGQNQWWKYLLVFFVLFITANIVAAIVFGLVIDFNIAPNPENPADLSVYGIDPNLGLLLFLIPFIASLFLFAFLLTPFHKRNLYNIINGTNSMRWNRFFFAFGLWSILMAIYLIGAYFSNPDNFILNFELKSLLILVFISLLFIPIQASLEELLFRGYLAQGVAAWTKSRWLSILIPGILFGAIHFFNPEVKEFGVFVALSQYIFFGLLFGLMTTLDDGTEIAMGAHSANNVFLSIFVTFDSSVLQTPALFKQVEIHPWIELLALIIMSMVFIFIAYQVYRWDFQVLNQRVGLENSIVLTEKDSAN